MIRACAVPSDQATADALATPGAPRLDELISLPRGPRRQDEILRIVAGLTASLAALHEAGQIHAGICPAAVAYDPSGQAILATTPVAPEPDAEDAFRHAGYAAFEQYTDDAASPCGPWTDVYGLAALAYFLATGSGPPSALARRVRDDYLPLHERGAGDYGKAFCDAIDSGLAMPVHARPGTVLAFAAAIGASLPPRDTSPAVPPAAPAEETSDIRQSLAPPPVDPSVAQETVSIGTLMAELPAGDEAPARSTTDHQIGQPPELPSRVRRIVPMALVFALILAGGGYAWVRLMAPPVQLLGTPQAPSPPPLRVSQVPRVAPVAVPPVDPEASSPPVESAAGGAPSAPLEATAASAANSPAPTTPPEPAPSAPAPTSPPAPTPAMPQARSQAAPVAVSVNVRPWGEVLINGRSRGVSPPLRELSLAPGRYQVTVRNASAGEHRMTLTVAPGRPAAITHEFK